jgi:hypothetical protein
LPDAVKAFTPDMSIDRRWAHGIDAIGMTAAGYVGGTVAANTWKVAADVGRYATYPLFESWAMRGTRAQVLRDYEIQKVSWEARGLPAQSESEWLRARGFGSGVTGILPTRSMPNLLGVQQTRFAHTTVIPINTAIDLGGHRIEQSGFIREPRIINTPTNVFDRALVNTNLISPSSLYDPMTSTMTVTCQSSITTREIVSPVPNLSQNLNGRSWQQSSLNTMSAVSPIATNRLDTKIVSPQTNDFFNGASLRQIASEQRLSRSTGIPVSQLRGMAPQLMSPTTNFNYNPIRYQSPQWNIPSTSYSMPSYKPIEPIKTKY